MNTLPLPSTATPYGLFSLALVAAAPSPENPLIPVQAIVLINPVPASTRRIRWLKVSAIYTLPLPSTPTPNGEYSWAPVAAKPSPENPAVPVPAMVLMSPAAASAVPPNTTVTTTTRTPTKPQRRIRNMLLPPVMPPVSRHHGAAMNRYHGARGSDGRPRTQTVPLPRDGPADALARDGRLEIADGRKRATGNGQRVTGNG